MSGSENAICSLLTDVTEENDFPTFGRLPDGSWMMYDARMKLEENTVDGHLRDGGGLILSLTGEQTRCANTPRTFLNEEKCSLSSVASACGSSMPQLEIELTEENIQKLHEMTGQYIYAIKGLPTVGFK